MTDPNKRPKVAIIGAGFGGITAARALKNAPVDIEIIDKRNYHLFQPLLYQVATADLSPADIAWPIRGIFSRQKDVHVTLSRVEDVDLENRKVICEDLEVDYDYLIVASGSQHSYFGRDDWSNLAPGLKRIVDATQVRRRVLMAFERAEISDDPAEQDRQLTFVIVGGGPTGVEVAGSIAELAKVSLSEDFRKIRPENAKIHLMQGGPRVLPAFPEDLSAKAQAALEKLGVDVHTDMRVEEITEEGVVANGEFMPAATAIWAAGVEVPDVGRWLDTETDRAGRVTVESDMSLPGRSEVFVVGDAAKVPWKDGLDVPGIAPAAKQAGKYAAKVIAAQLSGAQAPKPFVYRHLGNLATIGRNVAVINIGRFKLSGFLAWWIWGIAHIFFLIGARSPLMVGMSWFSSYIFHAKGARLITGMAEMHKKQAAKTPAE